MFGSFQHSGTALVLSLSYALLCVPGKSLGQVQIDFDLTPGEKLLGYENFGGETMDLAATASCEDCDPFVSGLFFLAVTATDRGVGCPTSDPLRIYSRESTTRTQFDLETNLDPFQGGRPAAEAVSMDEDLLVVGTGPSHSNQDGLAVVYRRNTNGVWAEEATLQASDPEPWDEFGNSVAVAANSQLGGAGSRIVVGAANEGSGANVTSFQRGIGAAYVFEYDGTNWAEVAKLLPPDGDIGDRFGEAVAIDDNPDFVMVGAPDHSTVSLNVAGAVYVFLTTGSFEIKLFEDPDPDPIHSGGQFGRSIEMNQGRAIVGDSGKVHLLWFDSFTSMQWEFAQTIVSLGTGAYGSSIGISDSFAAVGDPLADGAEAGSGTVFLYQRSGSSPPFWVLCESETNAAVRAGDRYGDRIGLDGINVAASAPQHDATGTNAGAIFVTSMCDADQFGEFVTTLTEGALSQDENFGASIAIDGNVMVVGIPGDQGCGDSGAAYIYRWKNGAWKGEARLAVDFLSNVNSFGAAVDIHENIAVVGAPFYVQDNQSWGAAYAFTYDGQDWAWDGWFIGPDGGRFGSSVAVDGTNILVGAPLAPEPLGPGRAHVYSKGESGWVFERTLSDENPAPAFRGFGGSVDLNSQVAVIGSAGDDIEGSVYVFTAPNWVRQFPKLRAQSAPADNFGASLALSGNTLLVGAPDDSPPPGHVEAFVYEGNRFVYHQTLTPDNPATSGESFARDLDLDGDVAIIGSDADGPGKAYVFFHDGASWVQVETLAPDVSQPDSEWGRRVAVSGVHLAVGAPEDDEIRSDAGAVFPFTFEVTFTVPECPEVVLVDEVQRVIEPVPDLAVQMGESVAVSRDFAAVGIPFKGFSVPQPNGTTNQIGQVGQIHLYERTGVREWTLTSLFNPVPDPTTATSQFGSSIAMDDDFMVVGALGATGTTGNDGAAFVFIRDGNIWSTEALLIGDTSHGWIQGFGSSVDIDGERIVVGAPSGQGPSALVGGGAVWIFERDTSGSTPIWNRSPTIWPADVAFADHVGQAVAISGDWMLLGVPDDDDDGSAYLFQKIGTNWVEHATKFKAPDTANQYTFGHSVGIDGNTFVVGATFADTISAPRSGAAYVWRYESATDAWNFEQKLEPASTTQSDSTGWSVTIDHHTIVVGSLAGNNALTGARSGAAFVFQYDTNTLTWVERPPLYPSDGEGIDWFGRSVALDGGNVWVGAAFTDDDPSIPPALHFNSGSAYTFDLYCSPPGAPNPVIVQFELLPDPNPTQRLVRMVFEERGGIASSYELWRTDVIPAGWSPDPLSGVSFMGGLMYEATSTNGSPTTQVYRINANP
jgi:hypothetical protein